MNLQYIPLTSRRDPVWKRAWQIYESSFPPCERRREEHFDALFADCRHRADGVWRDDDLVGILFHWDYGEGRYLEYLAIDPECRGSGVGARILADLCSRYGRVVLEIEPPAEGMALRRRFFYERAGFVMNPYHYIHPSYSQPFEPHRLVLMSYPEELSHDEAGRFADFVRERVMRYSDHMQPENPRIE